MAGGAEGFALVAPLVEEGLEGLAGSEAGAGFGGAGDFVEHVVAGFGLGEDVGGVEGLQQAEIEFDEVGGGVGVDADLYALAWGVFEGAVEGFEADGLEVEAFGGVVDGLIGGGIMELREGTGTSGGLGEIVVAWVGVVVVERVGEGIAADPGGADGFEGEGVADADGHDVEFAEDAGGGVGVGGFDVREVRGSGGPLQAGVGPGHVAGPAGHADDGEFFEIGLVGVADELGELAEGHPVEVGDGRDVGDMGFEAGLDEAAFDAIAAEGVGAVEDDEFLVSVGAPFDAVSESREIRVGAGAVVLQIEDQRVDVGEHFFGGFVGFAVEGEGGEASASVAFVGDDVAGVFIAVDAVFGAEECDEFDLFGVVENVDRGDEVGIDGGGVGDEAEAFALEFFEVVVAQDVDA